MFPISPQAVGPSGAKTSLYWKMADGFDTMYTIWNPTNVPQELIVVLRYGKSGEKFTLPVHLNEYASTTIDVGELIRTQQSDQDGNILAPDTHEGRLEVSAATAQPEDLMTVVLAGGIYNPLKATCGLICHTCSGIAYWGIFPSQFLIPKSQSTQGDFYYQLDNGNFYYPTSTTNWSSNNPQVATVQTVGDSHPGLVTGAGAGSTFILARYNQTQPLYVPQPICVSPPQPFPPCPTQSNWPAQALAGVLTITSISPATIPVGGNGVQVTISGSGFGTSPTLILPTGVTATGQQSQDTQITVTLTASYSATIGPADLSITASGATSNSKQITLNGPAYAKVILDKHGQQLDGTPLRVVDYQIYNADNTQTSTIPIAENYWEGNWSCTNAPKPSRGTQACDGSDPAVGGYFQDWWTEYGTYYTPANCGVDVLDHWQWCSPTGPNPGKTFMTLTGFIHTNDSKINGYLDEQIPGGTVFRP